MANDSYWRSLILGPLSFKNDLFLGAIHSHLSNDTDDGDYQLFW